MLVKDLGNTDQAMGLYLLLSGIPCNHRRSSVTFNSDVSVLYTAAPQLPPSLACIA
jgi:hypothetical protein